MMVARHEMPGKAASRSPSRLVRHSQDGDGGRARCDRVALRYVHHSRRNDALADQSYRSLRDGSFLSISQAFHAWLPSFRPSGTEVTFSHLEAHRFRGGVLRGLICYESRLFRKQFFGCRRQADTINPVMPKYFRLASGHRVIIRQTDNFEAGMDARLQQ